MRAPGKLSFAGLPPIRFDSHGSNTLHTEAPRQIALSCPTRYSKSQAQNGDCSSNARWGRIPSRAQLAQSRALRLRKSKTTRASFAATSMPAPPKHFTFAHTRTITFPKFSSSFAQPIGRRQSTKPSGNGSRDWGLRLAARALTVEAARDELLQILRSHSNRSTVSPERRLSLEDVATMRQFYNGTVLAFKEMRAKARAQREAPPAYPPMVEEMQALVERLHAVSGR